MISCTQGIHRAVRLAPPPFSVLLLVTRTLIHQDPPVPHHRVQSSPHVYKYSLLFRQPASFGNGAETIHDQPQLSQTTPVTDNKPRAG